MGESGKASWMESHLIQDLRDAQEKPGKKVGECFGIRTTHGKALVL